MVCCAQCGEACERVESGVAQIDGLSEIAENGLELGISEKNATDLKDRRPLDSSDDWLLEDEFFHLNHRVGLPKFAAAHQPAAGPAIAARIGPMAAPIEDIEHATGKRNDGPIIAPAKCPRHSKSAWMILSLGLITFVGGSVCLGWSLLGGRNDLWNLGMPMTLAGQFGLLLGLVLQLDSLWQANRRTADSIDDVGTRLQEINQATMLLQTTSASAGQSFYAHMAAGANPNVLLADLKGQLDMLTMRMSQP